MNGFERARMAIERLGIAPAGASRLEASGTCQGQPFSLLVVVRPATSSTPLQLVCAGEAECALLADLLDRTSGNPDSPPLGYSQLWWRVV